jgi:DNA-3-methyladenine glycosylase I
MDIQAHFGSFAEYFWSYVDGEPLINQWQAHAQIPASTELSDAISSDMKKRGFKFFGTTICYAYMQAMGVVNDHTTDCYRHRECQ